MRAIQIVAYRPEHAMQLERIPNAEWTREHGEFPQWARTRATYGPAYSFLHEGRIVACAGVTLYWEGVGEVWLMPGELWLEYRKEAVILTGWVLDALQYENRLRRIQAYVDAGSEVSRRFIEHYGFEAEGLLRRYDAAGNDNILYARIREDAR